MAHPPGTSIHLIADLSGCQKLDDLSYIEEVLHAAAETAGATVVGVHLHHFGPGMGVTGVAVLAESHISIHTWPETGVAAVDLFVCGKSADADAGLVAMARMLHGTIVARHAVRRLESSAG
ncbi:adenosylmethionine decarboxylase [Novosphingobium jiangmenense]|uniref:Adenosylmethionine decarboxylase n=1 Tax=Novosphingobium jiangmenense TaxID=2791981 RepID=A0ABS0HDC9_9SPHN|nr:adenosylmethionine decarboxylase [Novosphingobium jiangmenense]MBF9150263.1 adenosylmethionine decarboxylase [Novosphingobium jiangmenense]